jgi:hypothetical protein
MGNMTTEFERYEYVVWDRFGFHEGKTGWIIYLNDEQKNYFGEVLLSDQEATVLGVEEHFAGDDIWGRSTGEITWSELLDRFPPPQSVIDRIETVISSGPFDQEW